MTTPADRFEVMDPAHHEWQRVPEWWGGRPAPGEPDLRYIMLNKGGNGIPQITFNEYEPHHTQKRHRHLEDEILIIFDGDLTIGSEHHAAPVAIFVGRGTLYGPLVAGARGTKFFRVALTDEEAGRHQHDGR